MNKKNISFAVLEEIEQKKIEKKDIEIKQLYLNNTKIKKQIKILVNYYHEYVKTLRIEQKLDMLFSYWKNYYHFIAIILQVINKNKEIILENNKIMQEILSDRSKCFIKLKTWQLLNQKIQKKNFISKKILEQVTFDESMQLRVLKKRIYCHAKNTFF